MKKKPGVIFDMDGVIVHSNPAHKEAIQNFCERHNQNVTEEFMHRRLYGRTNKEWIPELFGALSEDKLRELADEKEQMFRDIFTPEDHVVEGFPAFLDQLLEHDIPVAVATSAPGENADYILSRLSIQNKFASILDSSHVSKGKPEPEVYIKSARALDRDPALCVVFEDSVSGVQAGHAAGAKVVGVTTTHSRSELRACDRVIDNFSQMSLKELLDLPDHPQS